VQAVQQLADRYPQKRVLITGATSGLGEALALHFAAAGFRVGVASRNPAKVAATCERVGQAGGEPLGLTLDVTRVGDFEAVAAEVGEVWGGLDILINNAGILTSGKVEEIGLQAWQQALDTDLWGVIHGCRLLLPLLIRAGRGHLANVASAAGLLGGPDIASYGVPKAGVVSLSESLAVELADRRIDVTVSCPTVFRSNLLDAEGHDASLMGGVTAEGLKHDMDSTAYGSEEVARSLIRAMARRRMYDLPQWDAKIQWWLSRTFPESYRTFMLYLYRNRLWVFNKGE
jgi:NAD(P)-dependent dehydrogenase (short-subunit alcohol dehydrogenase family)